MIQQTSIEAYKEVELAQNQMMILSCFDKHGDLSTDDVKAILGWEKCSITPRILELRNMGLLEHVGYKINNNNRRVMVWKKKT